MKNLKKKYGRKIVYLVYCHIARYKVYFDIDILIFEDQHGKRVTER